MDKNRQVAGRQITEQSLPDQPRGLQCLPGTLSYSDRRRTFSTKIQIKEKQRRLFRSTFELSDNDLQLQAKQIP